VDIETLRPELGHSDIATNSYGAWQRLARELLEAGSAGVVYPRVRHRVGTPQLPAVERGRRIAAQALTGFWHERVLFRFVGETEFGFFVDDERAENAIRGAGGWDGNHPE
jgi:hypothetical protein